MHERERKAVGPIFVAKTKRRDGLTNDLPVMANKYKSSLEK